MTRSTSRWRPPTARGITLTTTYDALGRKTALKEGDTDRVAWSHDK
ncbi:hypothetical protein ACH4RA_04760 [Streptomyces smyrnaeus]